MDQSYLQTREELSGRVLTPLELKAFPRRLSILLLIVFNVVRTASEVVKQDQKQYSRRPHKR